MKLHGEREAAPTLDDRARDEKGRIVHRDNITVERGTSASYLAARLKRDHPEIAEALARGENILSAPDIGHRVSVQRCAP